ncbi:mitotic checkpoint regulator, MAD2B-interacting-domain-containing protein [Talaromyces proteolyticus]|uniref:Mitotic checkpoint regulator, MAD2B-interacting-domain-containing protein n=1 Tax=Talaromyces proteolyticus TaxID=1131652 RepID=A0AAD4Q6I1_9EURO|nr:mitotic checkpoint regulator, MAD2B-interacting-domain-containing protein [Talaromyces proteolyticus]KAH8705731.1 mitotic checkpoint regulator, MAD2B-interacting-domain-containing protein [Talaromyces proteolyticus]
MALVQYSDSEGSDSEDQPQPQVLSKEPAPAESKSSNAPQKYSSLVDRGNPRKIKVALPEIKPEAKGDEDGPARKKPRTNGEGLFSGFNSILPAPKRANQPAATATANSTGASRNPFSLKTGSAPGFDRHADAELRQEQALNEVAGSNKDDTIPKPGGFAGDNKEGSLLQEENYKKKGNAMVFKPLSVARSGPKKKSAAFVAAKASAKNAKTAVAPKATALEPIASTTTEAPKPVEPPKPKVSLFSFSNEEKAAPVETTSGYESILFNPSAANDPQEDSASLEYHNQASSSYPTPSTKQESSLDAIANDLNLSRAERRQLMGRNSSMPTSRVVNFNTDTEYAANQEMLSNTTQDELAAQQHNPVRAIAPGKHSLKQLVQAASSQRDALEESFAAGRRNKKEAGSRYGW